MSSFIARHTPPGQPLPGIAPEDEGNITTDPFWPPVSLSALRQVMRIDTAILTPRLRHIATEAALHVNRELSDWRIARISEGARTLADVQAPRAGEQTVQEFRYLHAVYCLTKALLTERYRDTDTTRDGEAHAAALSSQIDDLWRDTRYAICDLLGKPRVQSEVF